MNRRALIAAGLVASAATTARAEEERGGPATFDMTAVGLPVVADDRVRNYIFVRLRLHLTPGHDVLTVRDKDPHLRDSLVRMAHRRPFTVQGDFNRLNGAAMAGHVMAAAVRVCGRGVVERVEVLTQDPQRRVRAT